MAWLILFASTTPISAQSNIGELRLKVLDPNGLVNVSHKKVDSIEKSKVSMMPEGLLDTFKEDEILDLVAYLLSRGDRNHKMFAPAAAGESR